jgi:hypothetical protein
LVRHDYPLAVGQLGVEVVAEQAAAVCPLLDEFLRRLVGSRSLAQICPCGCGLLAPIIAPRFSKICTCRTHGRCAEFPVLRGPGVDDLTDRRRRHAGEGQVVPWREADHPADAALALGDQQAVAVEPGRLRVG